MDIYLRAFITHVTVTVITVVMAAAAIIDVSRSSSKNDAVESKQMQQTCSAIIVSPLTQGFNYFLQFEIIVATKV